MAHARVEDIEAIIHPLGFFRSKAKNIVACAQTVLADFGGTIPNDIDALQTLPGVGRKPPTSSCARHFAIRRASPSTRTCIA